MCGLLRAQPFVTSATLESLLSRRRSRTPRLWRRRKLRQGAKFRITRFSNLYPRPILAGTIVWTSPTGRVYRTSPDGYDLFPQLRPACRAPTPRRRSHSQDKAKRIAHARSRLRDQRPVNAETRRVNRARNKKLPTAKGATTCAKCSSCSKAASRVPVPGVPGSTAHANPNNSHPTGNHHPSRHKHSTTSHPSEENYEDPCGNCAYARYKS